MTHPRRLPPVITRLAFTATLVVAGAAIADDDIPAFCRTGEGHPKFGREWCIEKGFGLGGDPYFHRGWLGREHRGDDDHWKEADKREREREREYRKKHRENEREWAKHREEMEREDRKHYEELERERRKHWEELDRESRNRFSHDEREQLAGRDWKPAHRSSDRYERRPVTSEIVGPLDPVLEREREVITADRARDATRYERY